MMPIIVADAGPLIALAKIKNLDLLSHLFANIHVPQVVYQEATRDLTRADARCVAAFLQSRPITENIDNGFVQDLTAILDQGEIQALALAKNLCCGVLMDGKRGRRVAKHYGIPVIGTLGVLLQAKRLGKVEHIQPFIESLQISGYRFSEKLIEAALQQAEER